MGHSAFAFAVADASAPAFAFALAFAFAFVFAFALLWDTQPRKNYTMKTTHSSDSSAYPLFFTTNSEIERVFFFG